MIDFLLRMGLDPDDFDWKDLALCGRVPEPEIFHSLAEKKESVRAQSKEVCAACPVREICLEEGIRNKEYGIWGGETLVAGKVQDDE